MLNFDDNFYAKIYADTASKADLAQRQHLFFLLSKIMQGKATKEDAKNFIKTIVLGNPYIQHLYPVKLEFIKHTDDDIDATRVSEAQYSHSTKTIYILEDVFNYLAENQDKANVSDTRAFATLQAIKVIYVLELLGHELKHHHQHFMSSIVARRPDILGKISAYGAQIYTAIERYPLKPHMIGDIIVSLQDTPQMQQFLRLANRPREELLNDIAFGYYKEDDHERDAFVAEKEFATDMLLYWRNDPICPTELYKIFTAIASKNTINGTHTHIYDKCNEIYSQFATTLKSISCQQILQMAANRQKAANVLKGEALQHEMFNLNVELVCCLDQIKELYCVQSLAEFYKVAKQHNLPVLAQSIVDTMSIKAVAQPYERKALCEFVYNALVNETSQIDDHACNFFIYLAQFMPDEQLADVTSKVCQKGMLKLTIMLLSIAKGRVVYDSNYGEEQSPNDLVNIMAKYSKLFEQTANLCVKQLTREAAKGNNTQNSNQTIKYIKQAQEFIDLCRNYCAEDGLLQSSTTKLQKLKHKLSANLSELPDNLYCQINN